MARNARISRRELLRGAATGAMCLALPLPAAATARKRADRWSAIPAPVAPRIDHWIEQLGRRRNDPYSWMKYVPEKGTRNIDRMPPVLGHHLKAEIAYADEMLAPLEKARRDFLDRMLARQPENAAPPALAKAGWRYESALPAGSKHPLLRRTLPNGAEETLFDEAERARNHAYYRATDHQPSPDDRYYAWAEDVTGDDRHRICVLDTRDRSIRIIVEGDAFGYGGLTFSPSSRYLFWIWRDARNRPTRLYRTSVDGGDTALVYEESDPAIFMQVARTAADGFVALTLGGPDMAEVRLIAAGTEDAEPRIVYPRVRGTTYQVDEWDGRLLMLTDADGAIDRKLLQLDPQSFAIMDELVPHRQGVPIISLHPFAKALVRLERADCLHRLVLRGPSGREWTVAFSDPAYTIELAPGQHYDADTLRIIHQTPADPPRWIDIDLVTGVQHVVSQEKPRGYDPARYKVERLSARGRDGISIPITVLSRREADVPQPLLITGYAAYGVSSDPVFSLPATVLVDAGFRYAIAHARGGSEKGRDWFLSGRRFGKRNSMTDFIACARHLRDTGYAAQDGIVAQGLSAGGLMVCGAMNIEPELWSGVIAEVPFVDMLNTMSDADHPLVPLFRPDWGDPLADAQAYDYIAAISPYENVRHVPYPPVLCTAGLKDDRVPYWEPAKLVAEIRHGSTGGNPAILALDPDGGHQGSGDRMGELDRTAMFWAFAKHCVGGSTRSA